MNFLDIILICIVVLFTARGFFRGLVQEILSLMAFVLAIFLASNFDHLLQPHLILYIDSEITVGALSYALIFFGTLLIVWLITRLIRTMLEISLLGWLDRTAGGVFGLVEGILVCLIGLMFLKTFAPEADILTESALAPQAQHMVDKLGEYIDIPSPQEAIDSARGVLGISDDTSTQ